MNLSVTPIKLSVLLFLTAIAVYWRALGWDFVLDDFTHIIQNSDIRTLHGTLRSMLSPTYPGELYRPLIALSYGLSYAFWGLNPLPYHVTNIILNGLNAVLIFFVLQRIFSLSIAGWSAFLFVVLPIHSEAVANIHGRTELLSAFFGFLFLVLLPAAEIKKPISLLRIFALIATLFLAVCAKESAVVFPLLAFLVLYREGTFEIHERTVLLAAFAGVVPYLLLRTTVLGHFLIPVSPAFFADNPLLNHSWYSRVAAGFMLLGKYLALSFFPWLLSADYSFAELEPLTSFSGAALVYAAIAIMTLVVALRVKSAPGSAWFAAWFFCSFVVTANILFPIGTIFGERLSYLPSVAVCGFIVLGVERFCPVRWNEWILGIVAVLYAAVTTAHIEVWKNMETLSVYQARVAPRSVKSAVNLAVVLRKEKKFDAALAEVKRAQEILPSYDAAPLAEATIYSAQNNLTAAQEALQRTLALNPENMEALQMSGVISLNTDHIDAAETYFLRVLAVNPGNYDGELGIFAIALKRGNVDAAGPMYRELKRRDPGNAGLSKFEAVLKEMQKETAHVKQAN